MAANQPTLWLIAGPNGSGKSTLYGTTLIEDFGRSVWIINPDLLTKRIVEQERLEQTQANLEAVERIMVWLEASLRTHQTVGVETVLSTDKYRALVTSAHALGFQVKLIYVVLRSPELNLERVRMRVARGGHAVSEDKVIARYARSLEQMPWFLWEADEAYIFDNSASEPRLIVRKLLDGEIFLDPAAPDNVRDAVRQIEAFDK